VLDQAGLAVGCLCLNAETRHALWIGRRRIMGVGSSCDGLMHSGGSRPALIIQMGVCTRYRSRELAPPSYFDMSTPS